MDPRDFFSFLRRRLLPLFIVAVIALVISVGYTWKYDEGEKGALVFMTIGMDVSAEMPASYLTTDGPNVVDQFTETVQGWLFNPAFLARVDEQSGTEVSLGVRKQEKQNLLVTVTVPVEEDAMMASEAMLNVLDEEFANYNAMSNTGFLVALSSVTPFGDDPQYGWNAVVLVFLALVVAIVVFLMRDYLGRRVTFGYQVEAIVGAAPLLRISRHRLARMEENESVVVVELGVTSEDYLRELARRVGGPFDYLLIV